MLLAFCNGACNFRRPPGFNRAIDAAKENGRSGRIIEDFGEGRVASKVCFVIIKWRRMGDRVN